MISIWSVDANDRGHMSQWKSAALGGALIAAIGGVTLATRPHGTGGRILAGAEDDLQIVLADYESRLRQMDRTLRREREQRAKLAGEVAELRRQVERLREQARIDIARASIGEAKEETQSSADDGSRKAGPRGLDVGALVAAGFREETVRAFKATVDEIELDRLYLRDVAAREGWLDTPRYREAIREASLDLRAAREKFGDELYDWMLYTGGHPNRVRVDEVIDGSAAAEAGLLPGDLILRYDDDRVFSPGELRNATTAGIAAEPTAVSILRDGRQMEIYVPRGPLGIRIEFAAEEPEPVS